MPELKTLKNYNAAKITIIENAFAAIFGYQTNIGGAPNPQTKAQFASEKLDDYVKMIVVQNFRQTKQKEMEDAITAQGEII